MKRPMRQFGTLVLAATTLTWSPTSVAAPTDRQIREAEELTIRYLQLYTEGKYVDAIPLATSACSLWKRELGGDSVEHAVCLNNFAVLHQAQGTYDRALPLYEQALSITQNVLGPDHPDTAANLNNIAYLHQAQGAYDRALPLYEQALAIFEKALGPGHPNVATILNNLATLYCAQGKYDRALPLYEQALATRQKALGSDHPDVAASLNNLAGLYQDQGVYELALPFYEQALVILEKALGPDHPDIALSINNLAGLYQVQGAYDLALPLYEQALAITQKTLGPDHPNAATSINNLAGLYQAQGAYDLALPLYKQALAITQKALGPDHPYTARSLNNIAYLYSVQGAYDLALPLYEQALAIRRKTLGPDHPYTATSLGNLALLYQDLRVYDQALPLLEQALAIHEKALGPDHPTTARSLNNLASLYRDQGAYDHALPLLEQALAIHEKALGPDHPITARSLNNLAVLELDQGRLDDALKHHQVAFDIEEKNLTHTLTIADDSRRFAYISTLQGSLYAVLSVHLQAAADHRPAAELALTTLLRRKGRAHDLTAQSYASLRRSLPAEHQHLLDDLTHARRQYAALARRGPMKGAEDQFVRRLGTLQQDQDRIWSTLAQMSARVKFLTAPVTIEDIQEALPCRSALVELVRYFPAHNADGIFEPGVAAPRYAAYLMLPHSISWVDLGPAKAIDDFVATFREHLARPVEGIEDHAQALYKLVMAPVLERLDDNDTLQVFIAPDAQLNFVPFGALHDGKRYLIESYALRYLTTGRDLLRPWDTDSPTQDSVVAVANPKGADLPGTESEADFLAEMFPGPFEKLIGAQATETLVLEHTRPRMLHLGTHGFFDTQRLGQDLSTASMRNLRTWSGEWTPVVRPGQSHAALRSSPRADGGHALGQPHRRWPPDRLRGQRLGPAWHPAGDPVRV